MTQHTPGLDVRFVSERSGWVETVCDLCGETILESESRFVHRDQIICEKCGERDVTINLRELAQLRQDKADLVTVAEKVGPAIQTLLDEAAGKEATDWGLVNECLLLAQAAITKARKEA